MNSSCPIFLASISAGSSGLNSRTNKVYERKKKERTKKISAVVHGRENMFNVRPAHMEDAKAAANEEEESPPPAPSRSKRRKTTAKKAKPVLVHPPPPEPVTMMDLPTSYWIAMHRVNPYRDDRDEVAELKFWTINQQRIVYEIFSVFVNKFVKQKYVNIAHFEKTTTHTSYFDGIRGMCATLNLLPLMRFQHDVSAPLVAQFYATMHFGTDMQRTLTWMSGTEKVSAPLSVASILGYEYTNTMVDHGYKIHDKGVYQVHHLADLYPSNGVVGSVGDLLQFMILCTGFFMRPLRSKWVTRTRFMCISSTCSTTLSMTLPRDPLM